MNPSITTFQVKASPLKDDSRVQQDQTPVSTDVPVTQLVPGHPTVAELKAAEDKKILMEKKKMENGLLLLNIKIEFYMKMKKVIY